MSIPDCSKRLLPGLEGLPRPRLYTIPIHAILVDLGSWPWIPEEAEAAIAALSGTELLGKTITIEKTNVPTTLVHMIAATLMNILAVDAIVLAPEIVTMADEGREITTMIAQGMTENGAIPGVFGVYFILLYLVRSGLVVERALASVFLTDD
ncbi:hypothetical protein AAF712_014095 [Marasmius tenuissimus]|uniref:Uncharacterized protein n=1 Tax=Marasmius tenuissimus TaxID=585030 RepID=A0ABR2ZFE9_9AGAR